MGTIYVIDYLSISKHLHTFTVLLTVYRMLIKSFKKYYAEKDLGEDGTTHKIWESIIGKCFLRIDCSFSCQKPIWFMKLHRT
mgnify:CR=1 FL=1